jgi:hypothetical protein
MFFPEGSDDFAREAIKKERTVASFPSRIIDKGMKKDLIFMHS